MFEQKVDIERIEDIVNLFGNFDENIKRIEKRHDVTITSLGNVIKIKGEVDNVLAAKGTVEGLLSMLKKGERINDQNIEYVSSLVEDGQSDKIATLCDSDCICITSKG